MPLGKPLTFDDELSASGKLVLRHIGLRGVGLRRLLQLPPAHLAGLELDGVPRLGGRRPRPGDVRLDVERLAGPRRGDGHPAPGGLARSTPGASATSPRRGPIPTWHDKALKRHITDRTGNGQPYELQGEEHLFERLKKEEPGLTREALHHGCSRSATRASSSTSSGTTSTGGGSAPTPGRATAASRSGSTTRRRTSSGSTRRSGGRRPNSTASACSTSPGSARGWRCTSAT